jgi:acetolactate synthase-1/2/3 large subunit
MSSERYISNGQQTLGVALPWAIAASIVRPAEKVLSISGDGGFLYSAMELETAVRLKANIVHVVWIDGTYDMVGVQEEMKYGRKSGVDFGPVDVVKFAEAFGATGRLIRTPDEIAPVLKEAFNHQGPMIVGLHVDYRDNHKLFEMGRCSKGGLEKSQQLPSLYEAVAKMGGAEYLNAGSVVSTD